MATTVQLAGLLPNDPKFRAFVASFAECGDVTADEAATFIRRVCKVESRRELATDPDAEQRFHQFLRRPFVAWRSKQHQPRSNNPGA